MPTQERQHAIITGGSSGIGKATALLLAQRGMHISLIARDPQRLAEARAAIEAVRLQPDQRVVDLVADVADYEEVEQAITAAIRQTGVPDILITSAGMVVPGCCADQPVELFEQTMLVNYFGTLYAIKTVLPRMLERRRGHLVLISSGVALFNVYGYTAYGASKFALRGLAEALRSELRPANIYVSIVYPPDTNTPMLAEENKNKPVATRRITAGAGVLTAEHVAQAIVAGIDRHAFTITPGLQMTLLARLNSLVSPLLNWHFDRIVRQSGG